MNGVTILNSYEYLTNTFPIFLFILLCAIFSVLSIIILCTLLLDRSSSWKKFAFLVICIALTIVLGCSIPENRYETRYQVTIDNSVSMNEFQSKYEIIKVEGKIYTIKERVE